MKSSRALWDSGSWSLVVSAQYHCIDSHDGFAQLKGADFVFRLSMSPILSIQAQIYIWEVIYSLNHCGSGLPPATHTNTHYQGAKNTRKGGEENNKRNRKGLALDPPEG